MQITIPDEMTNQLQQLAGTRQQPVEQLVMERLRQLLDTQLNQLPSAEQAELAALQYLSDDALHAIAAEQMPQPMQRRMAVLMERNSQGVITPEELQELTAFVERGEQLILRKAEAARLLQQRVGSVHQINPCSNKISSTSATNCSNGRGDIPAGVGSWISV